MSTTKANADVLDLTDNYAFTGTITGAGKIIQVVNVMDSAVGTGTTTLPHDDTIPQKTEGVEHMTLAVTPTNASNILVIEVVFCGDTTASAGNPFGIALFQDSTAGALASISTGFDGAGHSITASFLHKMTAGTTSETTFKVRAASHASGTTTFNGTASARKYGGVMASSITITEISV